MWHHIAVTRQGTALKVYYDGVWKGQITGYPSGPLNVESLILGQEQDLDKAGTAQSHIGDGFYVAPGQAFDGKFDEIKFFKRVLTADEIKEIAVVESFTVLFQAIAKEYDCADGLDNENDGLIDCADPDCANNPACELPDEVCTSAIDEDQDGKVSCADSDCLGEVCSQLGKTCVNSPLAGTDGLIFCCPANTCAYTNACYDYGTSATSWGSADKILCVEEDNSWAACDAFNKDLVIGDKECNGVKWIPYVPLSLADGEACSDDDDCESGDCASGVCVSDEEPEEPTLLANGEACTNDAQCESGSCPSVSRGQNKVCVGPALVDPCTSNAECMALFANQVECVGNNKKLFRCLNQECQPFYNLNDPDCVEAPPVTEVCNDGIDNDNDGETDCQQADCVGQLNSAGLVCCETGTCADGFTCDNHVCTISEEPECTTNADCTTLYADQIQCVGTTKETFGCINQECIQINLLNDPDCVETPDITLGDVNLDGSVNPSDAVLILQSVVELVELSEEQQLNANTDCTGAVSASDAVKILQYSVNLIDELVCS